jgi:hypothetical protein
MGALGLIEDEMAQMLPSYAEAAGWMADYELWHRREFLKIKAELTAEGRWEKGTTETQKKDDVEWELIERNSAIIETARKQAQHKAIGDKLFNGLDARRSIGQTLMKAHQAAANPQYGQEAAGQFGTPEPL